MGIRKRFLLYIVVYSYASWGGLEKNVERLFLINVYFFSGALGPLIFFIYRMPNSWNFFEFSILYWRLAYRKILGIFSKNYRFYISD